MAALLFFGALREASTGLPREIDLPEGVHTVSDLCAWLSARAPALGAALHAPGVRFAIDQRFAGPDADLRGAREIACMSALSGG